ncbi:FG-GAP repeat domain-containing protein [Phycicoccus avicenniae]|uniref:FG-GAP repeat domain-containing protein n=1 Tax=Phycicoccus avicenniae TaxID=2828860 RepID=UPI003D2D544D
MTSRSRLSRLAVLGAVLVTAGLGTTPAALAAADLTCPVLTSLTGPPGPVHPGESAAIHLEVSDDVAVARTGATLRKVGEWGGALWLASAAGAPDLLRTEVTPTSFDGEYAVSSVEVRDAAGNLAVYDTTTTTCVTTDGRTVRTPTTVDLGSPRLHIAGATDRTVPVLLGVDVPATTDLDTATTIGWHVSEAGGELASIRIVWRDPSTAEVVVSAQDVPVDGSGRLTLRHPGRSQLVSVRVTDRAGNTSLYWREGVVDFSNPTEGWFITRKHSLDFSQFDIGTPPRVPSVTARATPGGALLSMGDSLGRAATLRLSVEPGGIVRQVRVGQGSTLVRLDGLRKGVAYTWAVTASDEYGTSPARRGSFIPRMSTNIAVLSDVTDDRRPDVLALRRWDGTDLSHTLRIYATDGRSRFTEAWTEATDAKWSSIASARRDSRNSSALGTYVRVEKDGDLVEDSPWVRPVKLGSGWSSLRSLDGGFDLTGDGTGDIIAVASDGNLRLYARTLSGKVLRQNDIGTGWGSMLAVFSAGDLNGDRRNDVVAADAAGRLWLYPGNGHGRVTARRQIGSGWAGMGSIFAMRDFDGDGRADVGAVAMDGRLLMYRGTGSGGLRPGVLVGTGWNMYF